MIGILIICAYWLGLYLGKSQAHIEIALECERLGGFFVGKRIFKCTKVTTVAELINTNDQSTEP